METKIQSGTNSHHTHSHHIDESILAHLAKGELERESHQYLYEHLLAPCEHCEDFLAKEGFLEHADGYDLDESEAEELLQSILEEIEPLRLSYAQQAHIPNTPRKSWLQKAFDWHFTTWMLPLVAMAVFFVWFGDKNGTANHLTEPKQPIKQIPTHIKPIAHPTTKLAYGKRAFLNIRVERKARNSQKVQKVTFHHQAKLLVGDAMLFRFRIMKTGHLYLLRQAANGKLEQLYPFAKNNHPVFKAGTNVELTMNGQRVAYFLEPKHVGHQKLILIQSEGIQHFPVKASLLEQNQKRLFAEADFMEFEVFANKDRHKQ